MTDEELIRMFRSDPTWMGQEVANRIEALAAHAEAMAQIVEAYRERADVCLGHLPLHRKTVARIEALENEAVLSKAAYEGVSSLLLSVQQDCIKERQRAERLEAALQWCSGSPDFNEGGAAREGWLKLCAPLLKGDKP